MATVSDADASLVVLDHQILVRALKTAIWEDDISLSTLWKIFSKPNAHMALASVIEGWQIDKLNILASFIADALKEAIEDADPEMVKMLAETSKES